MPSMPPAGSWSYVSPGDATASQVDVVRFYLQDTDPALRLMSDLELQYLVDEWLPRYDSLIYVAAVAADRVATKFAGTVSVTADGVSVDVGGLAERYRAAAADLRELHKDAQVGAEIDLSNLMWDAQVDWSIAPLQFGVGKDDNLWAGRQNYGSHRGERGGAYPDDTVRPG